MTSNRRDVWFTSDTHFDHQLMADLRGFVSKAEHDDAIVQLWNETVRPNDIVWHLGDVGMGRIQRWCDRVGQLHGSIHLITGNHDEPWPGHRNSHKAWMWWAPMFESIQQFARRRVNGHNVLLSHFPYAGIPGYSDHTADDRFQQFRLTDQGDWLLHGHTHLKSTGKGRMIHVGLDAHNLKPVSLDWITETILLAEKATANYNWILSQDTP